MKRNEESIRQAIIEGKTSLGIEFGSTRIKAVLIDDKFNVIASGDHEWENRLESGFWTYHLEEVQDGLQTSYREMKQEVEKTYSVRIQKIGSIGISAMMHGYMPFNRNGDLLVPFRTWRNSTTSVAAQELTELFQFNIPERWTIAHLYQAILDGEEHLLEINYVTTLAGYIHWLLTGEKVVGIGDASGIFPIDSTTKYYQEQFIGQFEEVIASKDYAWKLKEVLPRVAVSGEHAGMLTKSGAALLDTSNCLASGIPFCPPEGDAGTGMVATNSVKKCTGNISVGTSVFSMIVLEKELSAVYPEVDLVTTPSGEAVAMIHANNCSSDINAWLSLFEEFSALIGQKLEVNDLFEILLTNSLQADPDGGNLLSYGYFSGENITGLQEGRPLFVRSPESNFNLANFMRTHLFTAFGALKIGMDLLTERENVEIEGVLAHGGLLKTPVVVQKVLADALNVPVSVMETAGEGGAWGMAILAAYAIDPVGCEDLETYLASVVFAGVIGEAVQPDGIGVQGFETFIERYKQGIAIEEAAVTNLKM